MVLQVFFDDIELFKKYEIISKYFGGLTREDIIKMDKEIIIDVAIPEHSLLIINFVNNHLEDTGLTDPFDLIYKNNMFNFRGKLISSSVKFNEELK